MTVKLLTEHHLKFLGLKGGYTGSSESTLVKMPHCWKSHVTAHIYFMSHLQEEFMDIPLSVAGSTGVEDSLKAAYLEYEMMEGKNQYRCSKCDKLVDAKKVNQNT